MTFLVVLMYYFMIGSIMGAIAALRCRHKAKAWAEYAHKGNPGIIYSLSELESIHSLVIVAAFFLTWPVMLWTFVKIMFGMKLKWEKENEVP